jgi:hypothetical protein
VAYVGAGSSVLAGPSTSIAPSKTGVTAGNLLVCCVSWWGGATQGALSTPTGWKLGYSSPSSNAAGSSSGIGYVGAAVFYKDNAPAGSNTCTVTLPSGSYARAIVGEFSGYGTTVTVDGTPGHASGTNATATASTTNTSTNAIVFFAWCEDDDGANSTITGPTGYTALLSSGDTNTAISSWHGFKELTSGATQSPSLTMSGYSTHDEWDAIVVALAGSSGGGTASASGAQSLPSLAQAATAKAVASAAGVQALPAATQAASAHAVASASGRDAPPGPAQAAIAKAVATATATKGEQPTAQVTAAASLAGAAAVQGVQAPAQTASVGAVASTAASQPVPAATLVASIGVGAPAASSSQALQATAQAATAGAVASAAAGQAGAAGTQNPAGTAIASSFAAQSEPAAGTSAAGASVAAASGAQALDAPALSAHIVTNQNLRTLDASQQLPATTIVASIAVTAGASASQALPAAAVAATSAVTAGASAVQQVMQGGQGAAALAIAAARADQAVDLPVQLARIATGDIVIPDAHAWGQQADAAPRITASLRVLVPYAPAPLERTLVIDAEDRTLAIAFDDRVFVVDAEDRTLICEA